MPTCSCNSRAKGRRTRLLRCVVSSLAVDRCSWTTLAPRTLGGNGDRASILPRFRRMERGAGTRRSKEGTGSPTTDACFSGTRPVPSQRPGLSPRPPSAASRRRLGTTCDDGLYCSSTPSRSPRPSYTLPQLRAVSLAAFHWRRVACLTTTPPSRSWRRSPPPSPFPLPRGLPPDPSDPRPPAAGTHAFWPGCSVGRRCQLVARLALQTPPAQPRRDAGRGHSRPRALHPLGTIGGLAVLAGVGRHPSGTRRSSRLARHVEWGATAVSRCFSAAVGARPRGIPAGTT